MRRRFPLMLRLSLALLLTLVVPLCALATLSYSLQKSIRSDMDQRIETTLDMAINMEESLVREGLADMRYAAAAAASDPGVVAALSEDRPGADLRRFQEVFPRTDMIVLVDRGGTVHARATSDQTGDRVLLNGLVAYALSAGEPQAHPTLIGPAELAGEGATVHQLVDMVILQTRGSSDPRVGSKVDTALALAGVAPVRSVGGEVVGAVIAADILNRDFRIVDEVAQWAPAGTPMNATIAMGGVRVTTNVRLRDPEGNPSEHRALGTLYSDPVMQSLTANGVHRGRAEVVGQWQRTIYRALNDYQGRMIAAPYVGIPEAYFATVGDKLTRSLQTAVMIGSVALLFSMLVGFWVTYRGTVVPLRSLALQLRGGPAHSYSDDEIGDVARTALGLRDRFNGALREMDRMADGLAESVAALQIGPAIGRDRRTDAVAAADLRTGAAGALEHLHQLSEAIHTVAEGVRSEERSIQYVGRVAQEIGTGLEESRGTVEAALADVGKLTASARAALKQAGELAAGLTLVRQGLIGSGAQHGLELLRDPSDVLGSLLALSDRVAGEVRTLVLIIQENQARLSFIREEMNRVNGVVQATASSTQSAAQSAGEAIGWMEGMAANVIAVADEVLAARAGFDQAAEAQRDLKEWCARVEAQVSQFRQTVADLQEQG